jgi:murein DD-endopeptidase MepM/ murein hydrolase activator NlpD
MFFVVPFKPGADRLIGLDLRKTIPTIDFINDELRKNNARYGIGGYAEHREVYAGSTVFDAKKPDEKPRRLHLGTDIWGKPYTAVRAPLAGIVHSFAFNDQKGDYGATIILSHRLETRSFFTLYGHLSLNSIKDIQPGQRIDAGEVFAEFGIPAENGQWPPHLHFQIINDIGDWKGDYPGVCSVDEKEKWLENSPDPDIILRMNQYIS